MPPTTPRDTDCLIHARGNLSEVMYYVLLGIVLYTTSLTFPGASIKQPSFLLLRGCLEIYEHAPGCHFD